MKQRLILSLIVIAALATGTGWYLTHTSNTPVSNPSGGTSTPVTQPGSKSPSQQKKGNTYQVKVFFSKHPESDNDPSETFAVTRVSLDPGVAKASIKELLKGPNSLEAKAGYFSTARLRDAVSVCSGADFKLTISAGTAILQFCKPFDHLGVVADGQAESEIKATLRQFSNVQKAEILNYKGDCEFDLSGMNLCKQ